MADYSVSVDCGNGGTNAVLQTKNGPRVFYTPSVRASVTGDSLGLDKSMEMAVDYAEWAGVRYAVGDEVLKLFEPGIERHMGQDRYGNEFQRFLVAYSLAKLGVPNGAKVDLTLFAPPGFFKDVRPLMLEAFGDKHKKAQIQLKGDAKLRKYEYKSVTIWPEGIGAVAGFAFDADGKPVNSDWLSGQLLVLDLGALTADAVLINNGIFNPEQLGHTTFAHGGIMRHVLEPIVRDLHKMGPDYQTITTDHVDLALRRGNALGGDYYVEVLGQGIPIGKLLEKHAASYGHWIANNIIATRYNRLAGIKALIVVGGGETIIGNLLIQWFGDKVWTAKRYPGEKISPVDMNAIGGLRLRQMQLRAMATK